MAQLKRNGYQMKTSMCSSSTLVDAVEGSLHGALWLPPMGHDAVAGWWFAWCKEKLQEFC